VYVLIRGLRVIFVYEDYWVKVKVTPSKNLRLFNDYRPRNLTAGKWGVVKFLARRHIFRVARSSVSMKVTHRVKVKVTWYYNTRTCCLQRRFIHTSRMIYGGWPRMMQSYGGGPSDGIKESVSVCCSWVVCGRLEGNPVSTSVYMWAVELLSPCLRQSVVSAYHTVACYKNCQSSRVIRVVLQLCPVLSPDYILRSTCFGSRLWSPAMC